ncbi:MAG: hypothetical protein Q8906_01565 [Bacillota bacterium]|nr:hypothetical protein [Bacillota bacterium]
MVTAILIPIICTYFFFLTKKEMKDHEVKWKNIGKVKEEAVITGKIKTISEEKQRFYYNRYIVVQEMQVQTERKLVRVKKMAPYTNNAEVNEYHIGERFRFYGSWNDQYFICNRMNTIESNN